MAPPKGRHRDQVGVCSDSSAGRFCDERVVLAPQENLKLVLVTMLKNDCCAATSLLLEAIGFLALLGTNDALFVAEARTASAAIGACHDRAVFAC